MHGWSETPQQQVILLIVGFPVAILMAPMAAYGFAMVVLSVCAPVAAHSAEQPWLASSRGCCRVSWLSGKYTCSAVPRSGSLHRS
jgi:hypothetical protein